MGKNKFDFRWIKSEELLNHFDCIVNMFKDCFITYHYPNLIIEDSYFKEKILNLKDYVDNNGAHVLFIYYDEKLIGFWWIYFSQFINKKRCHINCAYIDKKYRGLGLSKKAHQLIFEKAKESGCDEIATMYAKFNEPMGKSLNNNGFIETRVECVKVIS